MSKVLEPNRRVDLKTYLQDEVLMREVEAQIYRDK